MSEQSTLTADERMRIDKWLWAARFYKTRSLAGREARSGRIRLNGSHVKKASTSVHVGDVLTFPKGRRIFVVRILGLSAQRGPASVAQALYEDLSPPVEKADPAKPMAHARREPGTGRPTKSERRALDRLRSFD